MPNSAAINVEGMTHRYGQRVAVDELSLRVEQGELFVILGPNGSGKSTLFRVLSTLIPLQRGRIAVLGHDLASEAKRVRRGLGVVFQSPSLDKKLTVAENIRCHGRLFGMRGNDIRQRMRQTLEDLGLSDRIGDLVETLSGGLRRRVELAKALLTRPQLLLLDEPSTGLDPVARADLWKHLRRATQRDGATVALTSHLLDEADRADRVAIMDRGKLMAVDAPLALRSRVQGDSIFIETTDPRALADRIQQRYQLESTVVGSSLHLELDDGKSWMPRFVGDLSDAIDSISLSKPTLEVVFIDLTGHRFEPSPTDLQPAANGS